MAASCEGVADCVAEPRCAFRASSVRIVVNARNIRRVIRFIGFSLRRGMGSSISQRRLVRQGEPADAEKVMPGRSIPGGTGGLLAERVGNAILCAEAEGCSPP